MSETVLAVIITASATIITAIITGRANTDKMLTEMERRFAASDAKLEMHQAVTDTKIEDLTREVRKHNNFAERVPVLEEKISVANHRIADLEKGGAK